MATILDQLTPRQKEVALLIAQGKGNKEIAEEFTVSRQNIRNPRFGYFGDRSV
jgi:DNA-binding NarL/FixJ family response regulator